MSEGDNLFDEGAGKVVGFTCWYGFISAVASVGLSGLTMVSAIAIDEILPANDESPKQERVAIKQYDGLFNKISEQKDELSSILTENPDAEYIEKTPEAISRLVPLSDLDQGHENKAFRIKKDIQLVENEISRLSAAFYDSAVQDERLSEATTEKLFEDFKDNFGDIYIIAEDKIPDFADLDHCRSDNKSSSSITECTFGPNLNLADTIPSVIDTASFPLIFSAFTILFGFAMRDEYKQSKRYKIKHPNH